MLSFFEKFFPRLTGSLSGPGGQRMLPPPAACADGDYGEKLALWADVYAGTASWNAPSGQSLHLGSAICRELSRLTVSELELGFAGGSRADFLSRQLGGLAPMLGVCTEYACALGGVMLKPYSDGRRIGVECVLPGHFYPTEISDDGRILSAVFLYVRSAHGKRYLRAEIHQRFGDGYRIQNRFFLLENGSLQREVGAACVPAWEKLAPKMQIEHLAQPLFAYFRMPGGSAGQPTSPLGAPVFASALSLIRDADLQYQRLLWEFEGGTLAVDAAEDAFRPGRDGKPELPVGQERLFRMNCLDGGGNGELLKTFSPALRDQSLINGLNRILMFFEDASGVARGTFSDPCQTARTATEIRSMRQRTFTTVAGIQKQLAAALRELSAAADALCTLYRLCPADGVTVTADFGDSVLTDTDADRKRDLEEVSCGVLSAEEYRAKWLGTCRSPGGTVIFDRKADIRI